jgi:tripartite-type tricarboxylate transporter receptor subunit TctC
MLITILVMINPPLATSSPARPQAHFSLETRAPFRLTPRWTRLKGAAPALQDTIGGTVPVMIDAYIPTGAQVAAGKLRGLAIAAERRSPVLPDLPTTAEQGRPELVASGYYGLLAPARTPQAIIDKLHAAVVAAVNGTELREKLISQGYEVHASTPAEYAAYIRREIERWTPIVKAAGIKPQ